MNANSAPALQMPRFPFELMAAWGAIAIACMLLCLRGVAERRRNKDEDAVPELDRDAVFQKRQEIYTILSNQMHALLDSRLEVRHIMSKRLATVSPKASTEDALNLIMPSMGPFPPQVPVCQRALPNCRKGCFRSRCARRIAMSPWAERFERP